MAFETCRIVFEVQACNDAFIGFSEQEGEQAELIELSKQNEND